MSNPYSAPESIEPNVDRNASSGEAPTQLARVVRWVSLGCLAFIIVRFIFGHGVVGSVHKAGGAFFWLFAAILVAKFPRKSGMPVGIFMLLSVISQIYFIRRASLEFSEVQRQMAIDVSGMWARFYVSLLPFGIGGIACISLFWLFPKSDKNPTGGA
jgi:hypothetical protein